MMQTVKYFTTVVSLKAVLAEGEKCSVDPVNILMDINLLGVTSGFTLSLFVLAHGQPGRKSGQMMILQSVAILLTETSSA